MNIRNATPDDIPRISAIHSESWKDAYAGILPDDYLENQVRDDLYNHWEQREILSEDVVVVAETGNDLVGFMAIWCRPSPFIESLHVLPSQRSAGIGTALLKAAAAQLIEKHPMAMQMRFLQTLVEVGAENNTTIVFPVPVELASTFLRGERSSNGRPAPENPRHSPAGDPTR